ncbi:MAG: hypothetical protein HKN68_09625 [Saprospiraceae bacterium]|nr:hypothetical protein [Saprospiraceae bacterium]
MEFTIKTLINASPQEVYDAWLSSESHSNMTGGEAIISGNIGEAFSAWDGYIEGKNILLVPHNRIIQSWRTSQFEPEEPDSRIEIVLKDINGITELTLIHSNLSESGGHYRQGWEEHYFKPMKKYFSSK